MLGYTTFNSQRIRTFRLCNNFIDFLWQNSAIPSWSNVATCITSCLNISKDSVLTYKIDENYGEKNRDLLFSRMIKYSPSVSCDMNNVAGINDIVNPLSVKITTIRNFKDVCINKPPLWSDVLYFVNTPFSCINTTDTDVIEGSNWYS